MRDSQAPSSGYPRKQSGTLLELQGLMASEDDTTDSNSEVIGKIQKSKQVHTENDKTTTEIDSDSECKPLTDEVPTDCCYKDLEVTRDDIDKDLYTNERTANSIRDERSLTECVPNVKESLSLEITFQSKMETRTTRINEGVNDQENVYKSEGQVFELDLADSQNQPALRGPQISIDVRNTDDRKENTSIDKDGTSPSVSIDLSDHVESVQEYQDCDNDFEGDTCRICHCGNESEVLISPCLCTGTVKYVHHSCLMDWLKRCVKTKCELCLYNFSVHRKTKPLKKWRRPDQKPTPIIWLLTFVVALTLNIASIAKDGSQKCVSNPCIIFYVVGALGAMLGFAFFYHWLMVSIRYIKQWMALNEEWTLVESDNTKIKGEENLAVSNKSIETKDQRTGVQVV